MEYLKLLGYLIAGLGMGFALCGACKKSFYGWLAMGIGFFILEYTGM